MKNIKPISTIIFITCFVLAIIQGCKKEEDAVTPVVNADTTQVFIPNIANCWIDSANASHLLFIPFVITQGAQKGNFLAYDAPGTCGLAWQDSANSVGTLRNFNISYTKFINNQIVRIYNGLITDTSASNGRIIVYSAQDTIVFVH